MKTTFNWTEEEIDAKVDKALGDGFAQQLLDIKIYFDGALSELEKKIHLEILGQAVLMEFRAVQQRIAETQLRYAQWLNVGKKLIDDIVTKCGRDWKQFEAVESTASLDVARRGTPAVANRVCVLSQYVKDIVKEFEYGRLKAKSSFLFTCADKKHMNCTVTDDGLCNELSMKVCNFVWPLYDSKGYSIFLSSYDEWLMKKKQKETEKFKLDKEPALTTDLRADYPQFEWTVKVYFSLDLPYKVDGIDVGLQWIQLVLFK
ncbi:hypothetical protein BV898_17731 [Hypsibius exemplaris]|uniref:Uncharacterized protein n=1 Tax=Hypsibius exemplaris TaxID=2072580 RepID=A0A9X6NIJ0_HYPEX|nr:hypothetical protein BV898_17731 [Hypsibius exemplaris]